MQPLPPHGLVDRPQLRDRELLSHERGGQRRVLELGAGSFQRVGEDPRVVERELPGGAGPLPAAALGQPERGDRDPGGAWASLPARGSGSSGANTK